MTDKSIRVIFCSEGETWVAQGLEHDICVQANSMDDLYALFEVAVTLEAQEPGGIERLPPAPEHFQNLWQKRSADLKPTTSVMENYQIGLCA